MSEQLSCLNQWRPAKTITNNVQDDVRLLLRTRKRKEPYRVVQTEPSARHDAGTMAREEGG